MGTVGLESEEFAGADVAQAAVQLCLLITLSRAALGMASTITAAAAVTGGIYSAIQCFILPFGSLLCQEFLCGKLEVSGRRGNSNGEEYCRSVVKNV